jgi:hypothetical protein
MFHVFLCRTGMSRIDLRIWLLNEYAPVGLRTLGLTFLWHFMGWEFHQEAGRHRYLSKEKEKSNGRFRTKIQSSFYFSPCCTRRGHDMY